MVDCYWTFLADITPMINLYYILWIMLIIFMVDYIHGLPHATEMGACMKGLMGLKGLNAGGCALRLLYRPSA